MYMYIYTYKYIHSCVRVCMGVCIYVKRKKDQGPPYLIICTPEGIPQLHVNYNRTKYLPD